MGKALRVFVVILLLQSIGALVLGIMLFQKRDLLKGRTQVLENFLVKILSTVESSVAEKGALPGDPEKDISAVTAEALPNPDRAKFWEGYRYELEKADQPTLDLNKNREQLMQYFKIDGVTLKVARDAYGNKVTTGDGTMTTLLEGALKKAGEQYNRLNETRAQLKALREELIATVNDLNGQKGDLRSKLARIVELQKQITGLEGQIADLRQQIAVLEEAKKGLQDEVADRDRTIDKQKKDIGERDIAIKRLEARIQELLVNVDKGGGVPAGGRQVFVSPGDKGNVASVNAEWNFVVLKLNEAFLTEIFGEDRTKALPPIELMLKRPDGTFVTKIKLTQIKPDQFLGVADIMSEWQQVKPQVGDVVFY